MAQAVPATVGAGIGFALALLQKQAGFFAVGQLRDALLSNAAHLPFVQAVKVTGVHRAVALHHKISAAAARGGTDACRHTHRHVDVIVKQTHTGVVAVDPVTVVNVKQAAQELTVCFRRQCPGLRTTLALNGIQAGNELQMPDAQFFQRSIDFLRAAGHRAVDHAQQVYFYVMLLQNMQCRGYTVPGALGVQAGIIVQLLGSIQ